MKSLNRLIINWQTLLSEKIKMYYPKEDFFVVVGMSYIGILFWLPFLLFIPWLIMTSIVQSLILMYGLFFVFQKGVN